MKFDRQGEENQKEVLGKGHFTVYSVVIGPKEVTALLEEKGRGPVWLGENRARGVGTEWGDALLAIVRI